MKILENKSLQPYNTLGVDVKARYWCELNSCQELDQMLQEIERFAKDFVILGEGSNILFQKDVSSLVLKINLKGIELKAEDPNFYYIQVGAGENWHEFVNYCVDHNYQGIENLSLIPGSVGAAPIQNIGAYGVELKDVFYQLQAIRISDHKLITFNLDDCQFAYRDSIFKQELKNKFIIVNVTVKLRKCAQFMLDYENLQNTLKMMKVSKLSVKSISDAVIKIRTEKLPDPALIPNAGSFFKNPFISKQHLEKLLEKHPNLVHFPHKNNQVKGSGAWLIENAGWKKQLAYNCKVHATQSLVIVNHNQASGQEIYEFSEKIIQDIIDKYDIKLEREVCVI